MYSFVMCRQSHPQRPQRSTRLTPPQAGQDPAAFWGFAGSFTLPPDSTDCLQSVMQRAGPYLPDEPSRRLLEVEVAARLHSPMAELFRAAAARELRGSSEAPPCCWASVAGAPALSLTALQAALLAPAPGNASVGPEAFDHMHPGPPQGAAGAPFVALYAPLGSACGAEFHAELQRLASTGGPGWMARGGWERDESCEARKGLNSQMYSSTLG